MATRSGSSAPRLCHARRSRAEGPLDGHGPGPHPPGSQSSMYRSTPPETATSRADRPRVLVVGSHPGHGPSMRRYSGVLLQAWEEATGQPVRSVAPSDFVSRRVRGARLRKFVRYLEQLAFAVTLPVR